MKAKFDFCDAAKLQHHSTCCLFLTQFFRKRQNDIFACDNYHTFREYGPWSIGVTIKLITTNKSVCRFIVCYSTIIFETTDRLVWPLVHFFIVKKWRSSSLASHFWPTVLVLSIKNCFYKIRQSIFRPNYGRYEKRLRNILVHLKQIHKFHFDHFL